MLKCYFLGWFIKEFLNYIGMKDEGQVVLERKRRNCIKIYWAALILLNVFKEKIRATFSRKLKDGALWCTLEVGLQQGFTCEVIGIFSIIENI